MAAADKSLPLAVQPQPASPMAETIAAVNAPSKAPATERFFVCTGRGPARGKFRGQIAKSTDGEGISVFWSENPIEVVLTQSAIDECRKDPEIVLLVGNEISAEEAEKHVAGPVVARELVDMSLASTEALEAEVARRKAAKLIASRSGRS